jgi:aspartate 1-decarboxylase
MLISVLKSKIHRATVTASELDYEGSITIDNDLIRAANMYVGEKVLVANLANGARVETYIIQGEPGSGTICMNGAAAHHFDVNDKVIIMSFALINLEEASTFVPVKIKVDANNKVKKG